MNREQRPMGIKPRFIHEEHRMIEILNAMIRYIADGKPIPQEWVYEFLELYQNYNHRTQAGGSKNED